MPSTIQTKDTLFERVVTILEQSRSNIVRSVNSNTISAYFLIGREIVEELQGGEERAEYGKQVIKDLSKLLTQKYKKGFSTTNLWYFKKFYLIFQNRLQILSPSDREIRFFTNDLSIIEQELENPEKLHPSGGELKINFHQNLSWSHYRALLTVDSDEARLFYEREAAECGWSKTQLELQIQSSYYERILKNKGKKGLLPENRDRLQGDMLSPVHLLKSPYVLEFLDLPDTPALHENDLEEAIINNLQLFLLELGKGFAFVARQKNIRFDDDDFYVDLVFYNFVLKFFLLIDLKIGKLTHRDIGQMDGYVRLFEDKYKITGDNPTVGLILCSDKSESVARYSVLKESKQIFAGKYLEYLPSEEELKIEIEKERKLIEYRLNMKSRE